MAPMSCWSPRSRGTAGWRRRGATACRRRPIARRRWSASSSNIKTRRRGRSATAYSGSADKFAVASPRVLEADAACVELAVKFAEAVLGEVAGLQVQARGDELQRAAAGV